MSARISTSLRRSLAACRRERHRRVRMWWRGRGGRHHQVAAPGPDHRDPRGRHRVHARSGLRPARLSPESRRLGRHPALRPRPLPGEPRLGTRRQDDGVRHRVRLEQGGGVRGRPLRQEARRSRDPQERRRVCAGVVAGRTADRLRRSPRRSAGHLGVSDRRERRSSVDRRRRDRRSPVLVARRATDRVRVGPWWQQRPLRDGRRRIARAGALRGPLRRHRPRLVARRPLGRVLERLEGRMRASTTMRVRSMSGS